jgi:carbamoyl-phosphate synthase small subunit
VNALLVLEDGTTFRGTGFGARGEVFGEMVFNTGMTGYQETLTDPSYAGQIVAMTAPHIGNTGVNDTDPESRRIWVSGYVVRELSPVASSWRAQRDLDTELKQQGIPGIAIGGTRALTLRVREQGAMRAAVSTACEDPWELLERVLASPGMVGADLARRVSTHSPYVVRPPSGTTVRYRVAAVDLGIKASTPRYLAQRGCEVHVLPAASTARDLLDLNPDGVFFSNGPGDPAAATYAIEAMRGVLEARVPLFGICFGSQILGLALGLSTYKLTYGHRGVNQPVMDLATGRVHITSHNHGFAVLPRGDNPPQTPPAHGGLLAPRTPSGRPSAPRTPLGVPSGPGPDAAPGGPGSRVVPGEPASHPADGLGESVGLSGRYSHEKPHANLRAPFGTPYGEAVVSHVNLNDGVVEGIRLLDRSAFAVQYHPEAAPGTHDAVDLFDQFCDQMERVR